MDKLIRNIIRVVVASRESKVGLTVKPNSQRVPISDKHPLSDVELPLFNYKRVLDVLLSDELGFFLLAEV
jgi:hypothetical protein